MELYDSHTAERTFEWLRPTREIAGYPVRPGLFGINGAMALQYGVNFTIHTHFGTGCELLLFRRGKDAAVCCSAFSSGLPDR